MKGNPIEIPSFYAYLEQEKIKQENLTENDYAELRKQYGRYRNRLYKQRQRQVSRECILFLDLEEYEFLYQKAIEHHLPIGLYIKQAGISYSKSTFLIPDRIAIKDILIQLEKINATIDKIAGQPSGLFANANRYYQLLEIITQMRRLILNTFDHPVNVEVWIKTEIAINTGFRKHLISLLLNEEF